MDLLIHTINPANNNSLQNLIHMFHELFGIPVVIINTMGEVHYGTEPRIESEFPCTVLSHDNDIAMRCQKYCREAYREALRWGDTYISVCHAGFYIMSVPILYNEELIGGVLVYPFLMRNPNEQQVQRFLKISSLSDDCKKKYFASLNRVPVISEKKVKLAAELLFTIADYMSTPNLGTMLTRKQRMIHQAQVAEEVQKFKNIFNPVDHHLLPILNAKKEQELITKVRLGDKVGAKTILNEFLGQVMLHDPVKIELLKAYVLELAIILTRAVVEEGGNPENVLGLRYNFVTELADISDHETLCFWVVKVMESICDNIYQTRNTHHYRILEQACNYIRKNYMEKLTLETVAKKIFISPFYLCHLFKEELHTTFIEFLTKIRVEAAKKLLLESDLPLAQIALEVGYPDQSYFTKVFKKAEQVTPKIFRRMYTIAL